MKPKQPLREEISINLRAIYGTGYLGKSLDAPLEDGEPMLETAIKEATNAILQAFKDSLPEDRQPEDAMYEDGYELFCKGWNDCLSDILSNLGEK